MLGLGKDIYNAQQRILDHRAFVSGEINGFLNNFELKRNESEVETLFKVIETTGEIKYNLSDKGISFGTVQLHQLSNAVSNLLNEVEQVLDKSKEEKQSTDWLKESRRQREIKKDNFKKDFEYHHKRLDNSFEQKEEEIAELYSDLQYKLSISK